MKPNKDSPDSTSEVVRPAHGTVLSPSRTLHDQNVMQRNKVQLLAPSPEDLEAEWFIERLADVARYLITVDAERE
mgnify:CR=1 FL=1